MFKKIRKYIKIGLPVALAVGLSVLGFAEDTPPLDLTAAGVTLAGYIAVAAGAALAIFLGLYGIRIIVRAFKGVK